MTTHHKAPHVRKEVIHRQKAVIHRAKKVSVADSDKKPCEACEVSG